MLHLASMHMQWLYNAYIFVRVSVCVCVGVAATATVSETPNCCGL